jgi:hypothetical protein
LDQASSARTRAVDINQELIQAARMRASDIKRQAARMRASDTLIQALVARVRVLDLKLHMRFPPPSVVGLSAGCRG